MADSEAPVCENSSAAPGAEALRAPVVFLRGAHADKAQLVPVQRSGSVTLRDIAEEYSISSVLECDATGRVQPRAVAFDSPSDVLHGGKYYIARRDVCRSGLSPRVTFRGKILVEEFDLDHSLHHKEKGDANALVKPSSDVDTTRQLSTLGRKRSERNEKTEESDSEAGMYKFVPFIGDLYGKGCEDHIQLHDVRRLCNNIEGDEVEYQARHARALTTIQRAREALRMSQSASVE